MDDQIVRLDKIKYEKDSFLTDLNLWGVRPLITMINAAILNLDEPGEPDHDTLLMLNLIGERLQDLATTINRLSEEERIIEHSSKEAFGHDPESQDPKA
ncbi:MAG: hypothetical protein JW883_05245 [Deltaproteobacteria bacterium]|nr:hypothetical protein [Deltaproteobacteria bacterium]